MFKTDTSAFNDKIELMTSNCYQLFSTCKRQVYKQENYCCVVIKKNLKKKSEEYLVEIRFIRGIIIACEFVQSLRNHQLKEKGDIFDLNLLHLSEIFQYLVWTQKGKDMHMKNKACYSNKIQQIKQIYCAIFSCSKLY